MCRGHAARHGRVDHRAINHLIDADLDNAPPLEHVVERFKGADAYVAHNCAFERSFLGNTTWICTYKCALRVWPNLVSHSNQTLLWTYEENGLDRVLLP